MPGCIAAQSRDAQVEGSCRLRLSDGAVGKRVAVARHRGCQQENMHTSLCHCRRPSTHRREPVKIEIVDKADTRRGIHRIQIADARYLVVRCLTKASSADLSQLVVHGSAILEEAFLDAKTTIANGKLDGLKPSNPQGQFGATLMKKLEPLYRNSKNSMMSAHINRLAAASSRSPLGSRNSFSGPGLPGDFGPFGSRAFSSQQIKQGYDPRILDHASFDLW